jgi:GT2 family glycosyltransferase
MSDCERIGVVTITYNSGAVIREFMHSLLNQTYEDFSVHAVDNASTDDTVAQLSACTDSRLKVIHNSRNVGVAEGNNIGIKAALNDGCHLVLLVNNDTVFGPDLLAQLAEGLRQQKGDMAVPKILFFDNPSRIWCAGGYLSALRGSARHFGLGEPDGGQFDQPRTVTYSPTCCMLIRREVFDRIGLMDAKYFAYFDDTDFCWRARQADLELLYLPSARLLHKVASLTGGSESEFSIRYGVRNRVYYILKNSSRWKSFFYLPIYQAYVVFKYLLYQRRPKAFVIAQRALWEGISLFASRAETSAEALESTRVS